jgi:hypothetical protein
MTLREDKHEIYRRTAGSPEKKRASRRVARRGEADIPSGSVMISFYPWQLDAWSRIEGQSAVLAAPTGSGKTLVAYLWAGLLDSEGQTRRPEERVIFTAPIKALSNDGISTSGALVSRWGWRRGISRRTRCPGALLHQEIYTLKYAGRPGIRLVVDEFHYIFRQPPARTYVDGIRATSPEVPILVMSATFGNPEHVRSYLARVTGRPFALVENEERATELVFGRNPSFAPERCGMRWSSSLQGGSEGAGGADRGGAALFAPGDAGPARG